MEIFKFKKFTVWQEDGIHKVGTDAMILGALAKYPYSNPERILDVGTGTGVLALMLAQHYPTSSIVALDFDQEAVAIARQNFLNAPFSNPYKILQLDLEDYHPQQGFDLIISNPPYYATHFLPIDKKKTMAKHEGDFSLNQWFEKSIQCLKEDGLFWTIIPYERLPEIRNDEKLSPYLKGEILICGKPKKPKRYVLIFSKNYHSCIDFPKMITIRNEKNNYTEEYILLTKEFHWKDEVKP